MDLTAFLKTVPAAIGLAGLLAYLMRPRKPPSELELVTVVQGVRNMFLLLGCAALILLSVWLILRAEPPDRDAALLPAAGAHCGQCPSRDDADDLLCRFLRAPSHSPLDSFCSSRKAA